MIDVEQLQLSVSEHDTKLKLNEEIVLELKQCLSEKTSLCNELTEVVIFIFFSVQLLVSHYCFRNTSISIQEL